MAMLSLVGFGPLEITLVGGCFALPLTVFWIWMLIDCATKETDQGHLKLVWILIIIFTHWVGALIYLLVRRPQRVKELGQ
jgi:hypothetical protein